MALGKFKQIQSDNYELMKVQSNIITALIPIQNSQIIDGQVLRNISLTAGQANIINHRLNRNIVGYLVIRKNTNADVWDSNSQTPNLTILLYTDTNCQVDLYVF
jgi:hypothetical protein